MSKLPKGWSQHISYGPYVYEFLHDSYDGAPDSDTNHLMVQADSLDEAMQDIIELEEELGNE